MLGSNEVRAQVRARRNERGTDRLSAASTSHRPRLRRPRVGRQRHKCRYLVFQREQMQGSRLLANRLPSPLERCVRIRPNAQVRLRLWLRETMEKDSERNRGEKVTFQH